MIALGCIFGPGHFRPVAPRSVRALYTQCRSLLPCITCFRGFMVSLYTFSRWPPLPWKWTNPYGAFHLKQIVILSLLQTRNQFPSTNQPGIGNDTILPLRSKDDSWSFMAHLLLSQLHAAEKCTNVLLWHQIIFTPYLSCLYEINAAEIEPKAVLLPIHDTTII